MSKDTEFRFTDKTCHICYKTYAGRSQLYRHLREVHNQYDRPNSFYEKDEFIYKCLEGCNVSFRFNRDLRHHLNDCHNFNIVETTKQFSSVEEFHKWLVQEQESGVKFIKHRGPNQRDKLVIYYFCNRTGLSKIKTIDRQRQLKKSGTRKINAGCTSYLKLEESDGSCLVTYCDFHYGHKIELEHVPLPVESRADIVNKLANGAKLVKINLENEDIEFDTIQRSDLLTTYDLKNLKNFSRLQKGKLASSKVSGEKKPGPLFATVKSKDMQTTEDEEIVETEKPNDNRNIKIEEQAKVGEDSFTSDEFDSENIETHHTQEDPENYSDTEEDFFGCYVAEMLKQIDPNDRVSARTQVNEVLQSFLTK